MNYKEIPFFFACRDESLLGIAAVPDQPGPLGVLVIVGGPQYRIGSHRQFVHLSRYLAANGVACMRFDYHGMGDSTGPVCTFEQVGPDMRAAVDAFFAHVPKLGGVLLWGLCDGASAASFYAHTDTRVAGVVLLNPWVRTERTEAMTYLRHYYIERLFQRSFWAKVFGGRFNPLEACRSLGRVMTAARIPRPSTSEGALQPGVPSWDVTLEGARPLPSRMADSLDRFGGRILLVLSGNDYTATEFKDVVTSSDEWKRVLAKASVTWKRLEASDHTFSKREWTEQVAILTAEWVGNFAPGYLSAA